MQGSPFFIGNYEKLRAEACFWTAFRQKRVSGLIQRRLEYFYISNSIQVSVKNTDLLASLLTDHSQIIFSYCRNEGRGRRFWKFNNSLTENGEYVHQMKKIISDTLN